jgi:hypothetical protein
MINRPVQLVWHTSRDGHVWLNSHALDGDPHERQLFLTDQRPLSGSSEPTRPYQPLRDHPGLFVTFSLVTPTEEGIKQFADQFGTLGGDCSQMIALYQRSSDRGASVGLGETMHTWRLEIEAMRRMIELWEHARGGDIEALRAQIRWHDEGTRVLYESHPDKGVQELLNEKVPFSAGAIAAEGDTVFEFFRPGDLVGPALQQVQSVINHRLRGRISVRLLWQPQTGKRTLYVVPTGLIGGLWLQFAQAVEQDLHYRRCSICGTWFEIAPGSGRSDKQFCSNACRTRAYRQRQEDALRLHHAGRSVEQIAHEFEAETEVVRGWIEKVLAKPAISRPRGRPRKS